MIITILILTSLYLLLGHGSYLQSQRKCVTDQDKADLKVFRKRIYFNWMSYSIQLGKLRETIRQIQETERNLVNKTYPKNPNITTIELFSNCFTEKERRGSAIFASYIMNPTLVDNN